MDEIVSVVTPDNIALDFELAGVGSRLLAVILDGILIFAAIIGLIILGLIAGLGSAMATQSIAPASWTVAIVVLLVFVVTWGYFVLFEALRAGQTPGKRWTGIRVVRDDGLPVGWRESALRNLVRAADILPPPACIVGGLMVLLSKQGKRLGDIVAGTMVVREDLTIDPVQRTSRWGAAWVARVEAGRSRRGITLANISIDARQLEIIERFLSRRESLPVLQRQTLAWRIAQPFLAAMDQDPNDLSQRADRFQVCERILKEIMDRANAAPEKLADPSVLEDAADAKRRHWREFNNRIVAFGRKRRRGLRQLRPDELTDAMQDYRGLVCDLARSRSMGRDSAVVRHLNNIAIRAHNVLYGRVRQPDRAGGVSWTARFPMAVRSHMASVAVSAALMFGPAVISYFAVQLHPELGYDVVPEGFVDFEPARTGNLHNIPSLSRPIAASGILTNNIQVTLLSFGLGLTAGLGTGFLLVFNGVQIGGIAGWMTAKGNSRALWGWIMPHGGTELLAITLSGAAGFMLAKAIIAPGEVRRSVALRRVGTDALIIELGVMAMLVVAGIIEGFVSPSSIGFGVRIAILASSLLFWFGYLSLAGRKL